MIDESRIPRAWQYHTYVNGENFYTDQDNLVEIGVGQDGRFRVYNTSGHPKHPQATQVGPKDFDSEEEAEEAAIDWMQSNTPPVPQ